MVTMATRITQTIQFCIYFDDEGFKLIYYNFIR